MSTTGYPMLDITLLLVCALVAAVFAVATWEPGTRAMSLLAFGICAATLVVVCILLQTGYQYTLVHH